MTNHKEESLENALRNAKASMELSDFTITAEQVELVRSKLKGEINEADFLEAVLEREKNK